MKILKIIFIGLFTASLFLHPENSWAQDKIRIVATTSVFADITKNIVGDFGDIYYVASPKRDIHFISPTPKDVLKVKKADVLIHAGLDLEAWRNPLLDAAGDAKFLGEGQAAIDCSKGIELLEVPSSVSRAEGDIHLFGNPHYWVSPENAAIIAGNIANRFSELYPEKTDRFKTNADAFKAKLEEKAKGWKTEMSPYRGQTIITYHRNWTYFAKYFGLSIADQIEPKPGIPPTAKHISMLIQKIKEQKIRVIIRESYQEDRTPAKLARETGAKVVTLTQSVGEFKEAGDYFSMIDYDVKKITEALHE